MCLHNIHRYSESMPPSRVAYKVMLRYDTENGPYYTPLLQSDTFYVPMRGAIAYLDSEEVVWSDTGRIYQAGVHVYNTLAATRRYYSAIMNQLAGPKKVIVKVYCRGPLAEGQQLSVNNRAMVSVWREAILIEEVK